MTETTAFLGRFWIAMGIHLWQSTLIVAVVLLLGRCMRDAPARLLQALWALALLKLFLPLAVCGQLTQAVCLALRPELARISGGSAQLARIAGVLDPVTALGGRPLLAPFLTTALPLLLTVAWLVGIGWGLSRLVRAIRNGGLESRPSATLGPRPRSRLERARAGTPIPEREIRVTPHELMPCVVGLVHPRILVPERLLEALTTPQLRAVLLHEEEHRRRREPLRAAILRLCAVVLFFYPVAVLLCRRLQGLAEYICDENVLRRGIGGDIYAQALARTVQIGLVPAGYPPAAAAHDGPTLHNRLVRIRSARRYATMSRYRLSLALAIGIFVIGTMLPLPLLTGCGREDTPAPIEPQVAAAPAGEIGNPVRLAMNRPEYPASARLAGIQGTVMVKVKVGTTGLVEDASVATSVDPALDAAAVAAARTARFEPARKDGQPVVVWVNIPITFKLH